MSINFVYDVSGSMVENKSLVLYFFYTLMNIKESYGLQLKQMLLSETLSKFEEPQNLSFGKTIDGTKISEMIPDDEICVLVTDGCFSSDEKEILKKESEKRTIFFLLIGESANYQLVRKISKNIIYKAEDLFLCLNNLFSGALI